MAQAESLPEKKWDLKKIIKWYLHTILNDEVYKTFCKKYP